MSAWLRSYRYQAIAYPSRQPEEREREYAPIYHDGSYVMAWHDATPGDVSPLPLMDYGDLDVTGHAAYADLGYVHVDALADIPMTADEWASRGSRYAYWCTGEEWLSGIAAEQ